MMSKLVWNLSERWIKPESRSERTRRFISGRSTGQIRTSLVWRRAIMLADGGGGGRWTV